MPLRKIDDVRTYWNLNIRADFLELSGFYQHYLVRGGGARFRIDEPARANSHYLRGHHCGYGEKSVEDSEHEQS